MNQGRAAAAWMLALVAPLVWGCSGGDKSGPPAEPPPAPAVASVPLRIAVVDDAPLRGAIDLLRGEWRERSGAQFETLGATLEEALGEEEDAGAPQGGDPAPPPEYDLLVFPPRFLGELCEAGRLRAIRQSVLDSDGLNLDDVLPVVRQELMHYGGRLMALPLGVAEPLLLSRLEGERPAVGPPEWDSLPDASLAFDPGPLNPRVARGCLLLAVARAYGHHPSREALLFDAPTMAPRLETPPFERALATLARVWGVDPSAATFRVVWPHRPGPTGKYSAEGWAAGPLPVARERFDPLDGAWRPVSPPQATLVAGSSGALVGVSSTSRNAASASRLVAWLAGASNARQLGVASPTVAAPRLSVAGLPDDWTGGGDRTLGAQAARAHKAALSADAPLVAPRVLRSGAYLEALGDAVERATSGAESPAAALRGASAVWERITAGVGRDRQRASYQRHLGLAAYDAPR